MTGVPFRIRGFTLIEILVVLFIIGITVGFALLAFGDFGSKRRIVVSAEQFVNYVKFVQQLSVLETSTLGIRLVPEGYQIMRFEAPKRWKTMPRKTVFQQQLFPKNAIVSILTHNPKGDSPQIIINPSGDMTAFTLKFGSTSNPNIASITGKQDGAVTLILLKSP